MEGTYTTSWKPWKIRDPQNHRKTIQWTDHVTKDSIILFYFALTSTNHLQKATVQHLTKEYSRLKSNIIALSLFNVAVEFVPIVFLMHTFRELSKKLLSLIQSSINLSCRSYCYFPTSPSIFYSAFQKYRYSGTGRQNQPSECYKYENHKWNLSIRTCSMLLCSNVVVIMLLF